jgi:hypothetical protein
MNQMCTKNKQNQIGSNWFETARTITTIQYFNFKKTLVTKQA